MEKQALSVAWACLKNMRKIPEKKQMYCIKCGKPYLGVGGAKLCLFCKEQNRFEQAETYRKSFEKKKGK